MTKFMAEVDAAVFIIAMLACVRMADYLNSASQLRRYSVTT